MKKKKILLVEDDESLRRTAEHLLAKRGYQTFSANSAEDGLSMLKENDIDVILTDVKMAGLSGLDVLRLSRTISPGTETIVMTAFGTVKEAVEAIKSGAFDYVTKPVDWDELQIVIDKAIKMKELVEENVALRGELSDRFSFKNIIGISPQMEHVLEMAKKVSGTDTSVLILGESGTGKELVSKAIHFGSPRANKPFVTMNCSSIPDNLMESELFGHVKGAFSGAIREHEGKFERADTGTIFLDEIGDMKPELQAKLLRVLQEKEFEKVGGVSPIKVDVRIIAATNKDLDAAVGEKTFRDDLYFRLSVFPIKIPPLRERKKDIQPLAEHFLKKYAPSERLSFDSGVLDALESYHWPGNVRELENSVERAIVLKKGSKIILDELPPEVRGKKGTGKPIFALLPREGFSLDEFERELLLYALQESDWNQTKAAKFLGVTRHTLLYRIEKHGIKK